VAACLRARLRFGSAMRERGCNCGLPCFRTCSSRHFSHSCRRSWRGLSSLLSRESSRLFLTRATLCAGQNVETTLDTAGPEAQCHLNKRSRVEVEHFQLVTFSALLALARPNIAGKVAPDARGAAGADCTAACETPSPAESMRYVPLLLFKWHWARRPAPRYRAGGW